MGGALSKRQLQMDTMRADERDVFAKAKADLEQGISGVQKALDTLRNCYGASFAQQPAAPGVQQSSGGAGSSIIGMLEVIESDFSKNLAELSLAEDEAENGYQKVTLENKEQESANLKKSAGELTSDRDSSNAELSAVVQYLAKLNDMCVAKAETYEEKVRRRTAEIAGLKEALSILSESAFLQKAQTLHRVSVHQH